MTENEWYQVYYRDAWGWRIVGGRALPQRFRSVGSAARKAREVSRSGSRETMIARCDRDIIGDGYSVIQYTVMTYEE